MTRIGVLSDTHITSPKESLPPQLLEEFASVDLILHAGDWVDQCVLEQLRPLARVIGVRGNMDNPGVKSIMPELQELE
ncbi:MAG TPA: metallophosphoesterase, partial [Firmicutes bacterium]|nr:metallophosphoesterase [Bacillota bacterium]